MPSLPFNVDEREAQRRGGGGPRNAPIRTEMTDQHRQFFGTLLYVGAATLGPDGWPVTTLFTGEPGFIAATDPGTLRIAASNPAFVAGQSIALLGIDFATRRRNRVNGEIETAGPEGISIRVRESFGNCLKYIQQRDVEPIARRPRAFEDLPRLDAAARNVVVAADTMFVASRARAGLGGLDMSHRGGKPGFIRVEDDRLTIPDFEGNHYYNTFGNLLGDNRAALLFIDFDRGDLLQLQGWASIDWAVAQTHTLADARRSWTLVTRCGWRRREAVPLRWSPPQPSPFLDGTGLQP